MASRVRHVLRLVNVAIALVTLASALAVLASDLAVPGYREHYRDAVWFVALYAAIQLVMVAAFGRDGPLVPWLAVAKLLTACFFFADFLGLWPYWKTWTPARYVYQLFDAPAGPKVLLLAFVFLGRGAFNTLNATYFTAHWWRPLRARRPLLGRLVTTVPIAAMAFFVWAFLGLAEEERRTFSAEAEEVARVVLEGLDCDAVRENAGRTTTDLRARGERRYQVRIAYDCVRTLVTVWVEDGRFATAAASRAECCAGRS
jgi:hypothetical protein